MLMFVLIPKKSEKYKDVHALIERPGEGIIGEVYWYDPETLDGRKELLFFSDGACWSLEDLQKVTECMKTVLDRMK